MVHTKHYNAAATAGARSKKTAHARKHRVYLHDEWTVATENQRHNIHNGQHAAWDTLWNVALHDVSSESCVNSANTNSQTKNARDPRPRKKYVETSLISSYGLRNTVTNTTWIPYNIHTIAYNNMLQYTMACYTIQHDTHVS